jgi:hypothetical protein
MEETNKFDTILKEIESLTKSNDNEKIKTLCEIIDNYPDFYTKIYENLDMKEKKITDTFHVFMEWYKNKDRRSYLLCLLPICLRNYFFEKPIEIGIPSFKRSERSFVMYI